MATGVDERRLLEVLATVEHGTILLLMNVWAHSARMSKCSRSSNETSALAR